MRTAGYRHDLTGLRFVAVLLVVLFHADVPGLHAGFVGVDVFFALSGFLITRGLVTEIDNNGRVDLLAFWAARARRLLPAATLAISVTLIGSLLVMSPFVWRERVADAWASSLYFANFRFGSADQSYFGATTGESPFLHFWSLSIEEQTYVALPLLMALVLVVPNRRPRDLIVRLLWALFAGSLLLSLLTTQVDRTPMTYFHSATRVWEIAAGGLLAVHFSSINRLVQQVSPTGVRLAGLGLLALSVAVVEPFGVFPGAVAILPVTGALMVVAAVGGRDGVLVHPVAQWVGDRSYSWYLWHWPVIVLGQSALGRWWGIEPSWPLLVALAGASLLPSAASYRWVEQPLRTSPWLGRSLRTTTAGIGPMVLASFVLLAGLGAFASWRLSEPELLALDIARTDYPSLPEACSTTDVDQLLSDCAVGSETVGAERVLLLGDSHMANWAPAFTAAAIDQDLQVVSALGGSCPIIGSGVTFDPWWCEEMRAGVLGAVDAIGPSTVVLSHSPGYYSSLVDRDGEVVPSALGLDVWISDLVDFVGQLRDRDVEVIVVQPTPSHDEPPIFCVSLGREPNECVASRSELAASVAAMADAQREALIGLDGVSIFDPIDVVCPTETCLFEENGHYVWNDEHHITNAYSVTKASAVAPFFD